MADCDCHIRKVSESEAPRESYHPKSIQHVSKRNTMLSRWCRVFYRARSRYQRRRLCLWVGSLTMLICLMYYNQQSLAQLSFDQAGSDFRPNEQVGRQPQALNQDRLREVIAPPADVVRDDDKDDDDKSDLRSGLAPATLHFLWCGRRHFEFRHYMAVKRADKLIRPDKIFFHFDHLPVVDNEGYFLWFNRTLAEVDNILLRPFNASSECPTTEGGGTAARYLAVLDILWKFGGIYVPEDSILVDFPVHLRSSHLVAGVTATTPTTFQDGLVAGMKESFQRPSDAQELLVLLGQGNHQSGGIQPCGSIEHYNKEEDGDCICVKVTKNIYPKDVLDGTSRLSSTSFAKLARVAAYGQEVVQTDHGGKNLIPRIAHYVCIDCELSFIMFLSMRSALNVAGLNKVYLHGVKQPYGKWWEKLQGDSRFVYVHREYPETLYDPAVVTHDLAIGIMRISILIKYGGVYCDKKVLWTNRIPEHYYGYAAVASPDWHLLGAWPDSVNHAVLMAKKNSHYLLKLRSVLHTYRQHPFVFNDQYMAYKIFETHPNLIHLDRHLQVACVNHNCHPTWQENYRSGETQNRPGGAFSWQNDTLTIHWTDTFPELDLDQVKYTSGMIVDICRNILTISGIVLQNLK